MMEFLRQMLWTLFASVDRSGVLSLKTSFLWTDFVFFSIFFLSSATIIWLFGRWAKIFSLLSTFKGRELLKAMWSLIIADWKWITLTNFICLVFLIIYIIWISRGGPDIDGGGHNSEFSWNYNGVKKMTDVINMDQVFWYHDGLRTIVDNMIIYDGANGILDHPRIGAIYNGSVTPAQDVQILLDNYQRYLIERGIPLEQEPRVIDQSKFGSASTIILCAGLTACFGCLFHDQIDNYIHNLIDVGVRGMRALVGV